MSDPKVVGMYDNNCTLKNVQEQISKSTNLTKNEIYKKKNKKRLNSTPPHLTPDTVTKCPVTPVSYQHHELGFA